MRRPTAFIIALATFATFGFAGASHAQYQWEDREIESRVYIGGAGAFSFLFNAEDEFTNSIVRSKFDDSFGAAFIYGVRTDIGFSVELEVEWIQGYDIVQTTALGTTTDELTTYTVSSNVGYHPFDGVVDPYISLGAGWMHATLDDFGVSGDGLVVRVGLGANFWVTDHIGVRLEGQYTHPLTSQIEHFENIQPRVGLFYRF